MTSGTYGPHAPLVVAVAGGSGSGKTSVARALAEAVDTDGLLIDQDAYYKDLADLPFEERTRVNFDHPDAFDTDLLIAHLQALKARRPIDKPTYDYAAHTRAAATTTVAPRDVVIVEGILIFADARLRAEFDIRIFVDVADDVRFIRRLRRDTIERGRSVHSVIEQYLTTVRPMHLEFVEPSKRHADVILPEGGENRVGIELVQAHVERALARRRHGMHR